MLIELKDGGVKEIYTDEMSYGGCETCDYGSEYINEFRVEMTTGNIEVEINKMYSYAVSADYLLKLFLTNIDIIKQMAEKELYKWIESKLKSDYDGYVQGLKINFISK